LILLKDSVPHKNEKNGQTKKKIGVILIIPVKYIPFLYTSIFALILIKVVPKAEIRRLFIYGLIFGGVFDILVVTIGNLIDEFGYIQYEEFGLMGIHFMAPISWTIFFMIYFYFLPHKKLYICLYTLMGIIYSVLFCQMVTKLGVLFLAHGLISSIIPFIIWFPIATWGYLKLQQYSKSKQLN
jgi:hypothetical protein